MTSSLVDSHNLFRKQLTIHALTRVKKKHIGGDAKVKVIPVFLDFP